jgi:hypothetical protein
MQSLEEGFWIQRRPARRSCTDKVASVVLNVTTRAALVSTNVAGRSGERVDERLAARVTA